MHRKTLIAIKLTICASALITGTSNAQTEANHLRAQHREVLNQWLKTKPALRLATEKDCRNKEGLSATREENGKNYQPYYAVGDFNRDGRDDFAVALVNDAKRSRNFAIAIFNGPFVTGQTKAANFFADGTDLSNGGLVWLSGNRLLAGVFQSDDCVRLIARGRGYVMKNCV